MNKVININKAIVTSSVLTVSFILLVGSISMTMNVAQGNTANSTQSQNDTGNNALAKSGGGNQPSQGIKGEGEFPTDINTGETGDNTP